MIDLGAWTQKLNEYIKDKFTYSSSWTNPNEPERIMLNDERPPSPKPYVEQYVPTPAQNIPEGGFQQRTLGASDASQQRVPIQREYEDRPPVPEAYLPYLSESAQSYNIDPNVLASLLASESGGFGYNPSIVGGSGEVGLSQITPELFYEQAQFGNPEQYAQALQDPAFSIDQAAIILADLLSQYDQNYYDALGAYNAGPTGYNKGNYEPQYPIDTLKRVGMMGDYVSQVPSGYEQYLPEELLNQYLAMF